MFKRIPALAYTFILALLITSLVYGGEFRKLGVNDLEWGVGTTTSPAGKVVTKIPLGEPTDNSFMGLTDVKAFGAVGNGTADDTAAINSALASGKVVLFPSGTYKVTDKLVMNEGNFIVGAGPEKTIINSTATEAGEGVFHHTNAAITYGFGIANLRINVPASGGWGIYIGAESASYYQRNIVIKNVKVYTGGAGGIYLGTVYQARIEDCDVEKNGDDSPQYGIYLGHASNANLIVNSWVSHASVVGIHMKGASGNTVLGGAVQGCAIGIKTEDSAVSATTGASGNTFQNIWYEGNTGDSDVYLAGTYSDLNNVIGGVFLSTAVDNSIHIGSGTDRSTVKDVISSASDPVIPGIMLEAGSTMNRIISPVASYAVDGWINDFGTNNYVIFPTQYDTVTYSRMPPFKMRDSKAIVFGDGTGGDNYDASIYWEPAASTLKITGTADLRTRKRAAINTADNLVLADSGTIFTLAGNGTVNSISTNPDGQEIFLIVNNPIVVNDNNNLALTENFAPTGAGVLHLICDGTYWYEVSRSDN